MGTMESLEQQATAAAKKFAGDNPQLGQEIANIVHAGPGGISGLVQKFQAGGFGHLVQSWVSTGANQLITPEQLQQVLGSEKVKQIATRLGLDPNVVSQRIATILPEVVNHLTPNGQVPQAAAPAAPQASPPA